MRWDTGHVRQNRKESSVKISCISFTQKGTETAVRVGKALEIGKSNTVDIWTENKSGTEFSGAKKITANIHSWLNDHFHSDDAIIFVGAVGIAVRLIAPLIQSKAEDPAVVVVDEAGKWAISLLSGHIGGANDLARAVAAGIGAEAIVTTATDIRGKFAVDTFATLNDMAISSMELAKEISSAVLGGRPVGFYADPLFPIDGDAPSELSVYPPDISLFDEEACQDRPGLGISVTLSKDKQYFENNLALVPRAAVLGVGCRKGIEPADLERFLFNFLDASQVSLEAVSKVTSIDLKAQEPAIRIFCRKYDLPFETYTVQQLARVPGRFSESSFVLKTIGIDNVCERSAVLGAMDRDLPGKLIVEKKAYNGMTAALALAGRRYSWRKPV